MPKASSTPVPPQSALRRNQACHQCRKRKLKCDALLPCGPCSKSHAHAFKLNPTTTPAEPDCSYDNPEEVAEGPKGKILRLEARITELEEELEKARKEIASCTCQRGGSSSSPSNIVAIASSIGTTPAVLDVSPPQVSAESFELLSGTISTRSLPYPDPPIMIPGDMQIMSGTFHVTTIPNVYTGPSTITHHMWPLNIPPPDLLHHLVDTFFTSVPLATRLLHRPTFMANLQRPPTHPDFPHVCLLHAICGLASLYTPVITDKPADLNKGADPVASFHSGVVYRANAGEQGPYYLPRKIEDVMGDDEVSFGAAHIRWASAAYRLAMQNGDRLLQLLQAGIVCAWYNHSTGRTVNAFSWIGISCRMSLPLGLGVAEGFEPLSRLPVHMLSLLPRSKSPVDAEMKRNVFWLVYSMERMLTAGTVWPLTVTDEDCSQIMPARITDFVNGLYVPTQGRQHLFSNKMLITHPRLSTDSFTLYIKATILLGRVKSFNVRFKMRYADLDSPASSPYAGASAYSSQTQHLPKVHPRDTPEFQVLDSLIQSFTPSIPKEFRDPVGIDSGTKLDPVLYVAHLVPHVAMILLHDPHADLTSPNCPSSERMLLAARAILDLIYKICGTTYDLIYLDHSCSFCWFIAGATIIRFLKAKMIAGDEAEVARMTQELGVVRFMLSNLGDRTIVGLRQIKLLDDIYNLEMGSFTANDLFGSGALSEVPT